MTRIRLAGVFVGLLLIAPEGSSDVRESRHPSLPESSAPRSAAAWKDLLPVAFDSNLGQYDPTVDGAGRAGGLTAYLTPEGLLLATAEGGSGSLRFEGARTAGHWRPLDALPGRNHHLIGADPARWVRNAARFGRMVLADPWPGVTAELRGDGNRLAYGFRVAPGADPAAIRLGFPGARGFAEGADGSLVVDADACRFLHSPPRAWQEMDGRRVPRAVRFLRRGAAVGFEVEGRDPSFPLVIDPRIEASAYLGGSGTEEGTWGGATNQVYCLTGNTVACDGAGNVVIVGKTASLSFPVKNPFQQSAKSTPDAFVTKVQAGTLEVDFSTFIGGSGFDGAHAVDIGSDGGIAVAADTTSYNFPLTADAFQAVHLQYEDIVVFKLAADGSSLLLSTFLGGGRSDVPRAVAALDDGTVVVAGNTESGYGGTIPVPTANALQGFNVGGYDAYVARVSSDGKTLKWGTYWGGSGSEQVGGMAVDGSGSLVIVGYTDSQDFPVASALRTTSAGGRDAFLLRIDPSGPSVQSSTYFGGTGDDNATCVDIDSNGGVLVGGATKSDDLPVLNPVQAARGGSVDAFLARFTGDLSQETFGTYLGGGSEDLAMGVVAGTKGRVFLGGVTWSLNFPVVDPYQQSRKGSNDAFLSRISTAGGGMTMSTYLGGSSYDYVRGLAGVSPGTVMLAGWTQSADWPTAGGTQPNSGGQEDAYYTQFSLAPARPSAPTAEALSSSEIEVRWGIGSNNEDGFEVQRKSVAGIWATIQKTGPGIAVYSDITAQGNTTYTYRIRSFNGEGESAFSAEATATTPVGPPGAPLAPGTPTAAVQTPRSVLVAWEDRSDSEDSFVISRRTPAGTFTILGTVGADVTSYLDGTVLPGRSYVYSLRAANSGGYSLPTAAVTVEVPATLVLSLAKGKAKDSPIAGKDSLKISGILGLGEGATETGLEPASRALQVRFGGWDSPLLLTIPAGDEGWKERKGTWTWKAPKGSVTKASLKLVPATGAFTLTLSRFTFPGAMAESVTFTVGLVGDGGSAVTGWTAKKAGNWKLP